MTHIVLRDGEALVFHDGVAREAAIPCEGVPAGHYLLKDDLRPLCARDISNLALRGRAYGVRARWWGQEIAINGRHAPISTHTGEIPDALRGSVAEPLTILSVLP